MAAKKKTTTKKTTKKSTRKTARPKRTAKASGKKTTAKKTTTKKAAKKKMSALDAAAKVLGESKEPLNTKAMIARMAEKKYWTSPGGQTPHATLYSAILCEIQTKGKEACFKKVDRGHFELA